MQTIEARLARLEREVRRWRVAAAMGGVAATCALLVAAQSRPPVPKVIEADYISAKRFSLLLDGKVRAELGVDDQGPDNRIPGLFLYGKDGKAKDDLARFVVFGQTDTPEVAFRGASGAFRMMLSGTDQGAALHFFDENGVATKTVSAASR